MRVFNHKSLLVLQWNGFRLRAAVAQVRRGRVSLQHAFESREAEPQRAVKDIVAQFSGAELPRKAILLTSEAVAAVLELPVDPAAPRSQGQMAEMVRWEIDGYLATQAHSHSIEEILLGQGLLTRDQLCELRDVQQSGIGPANASQGKARIEDLAMARGMLTRAQLDQCLATRNRSSVESNEECHCGWVAITPDSSLAEQLPGLDLVALGSPGQFAWLASGIGNSARTRWAMFCQAAGLTLQGIYPLVGCAVEPLQDQWGGHAALVLELLPGSIGITHVKEGAVQKVEVRRRDPAHDDQEACLTALQGQRADAIWLCGQIDDAKALEAGLESATNVRTQVARIDDLPPSNLSMLGAARHALLQGNQQLAAVAAQDPLPPLTQRFSMQAAAVLAVCVALLVATELYQGIGLARAQKEQKFANGELAQLIAERDRIDQLTKRVEQLKESLSHSKNELANVQHRYLVFSEQLPAGNRFVAHFLDALSRAVQAQVVVEGITIDDATLRVSAWSLSESAAQEFVQSLTAAVQHWPMEPANVSVTSKTGRLGLDGYAIEFELAQTAAKQPIEAEAPDVNPKVNDYAEQ